MMNMKGGGTHVTLLLKLVEVRQCGEIAKREGESAIGQYTNRGFECGFWAHSRDGIAGSLAR